MYRLKHLTDKTKHWKAIVVTLAAMVVFVTTYLLILPAVTLDEETAEAQGGIDVNVEEPVADASDPAEAPEDTDAVKDADNAKADDVKTNDAEENDSDEDNDAEVKPDKAKAAKETSISDGGKTYDVNVTCGEDAGVPEDAMLEVSEISQKTDEYKELFSKTEEALGEDTPVSFARFFDIKIVDGSGDKVEIAAPVDVKIELTDKDGKKEYGKNTQVVHFPDKAKKGEVIEDVDVKGATVSFLAEGFSEYAIIDTTIEKTVLASDGNNYHIKVTCDPDSGIPANADLAVKEILSDSDQYQDYAAKAESAVGLEEGSAEYIRLFDIKIVDKDDPSVQYQPAKGSTVDVRIELEDSESKELSVVHFSDKKAKGDVVDAAVDGKTVKFAASGFSVYAVVEGSTDDNARMKLEFYSGNDLVDTMYVKNGDTLDELQEIIYDPGAGTLNAGEVFGGWILDKQNYTTADVSGAWTIDDVREWAAAKSITEGETHRLDAAICKLYNVTYYDYLDDEHLDQHGATLGKDGVLVKSSEYGSAEVEYTVDMGYTPKDDVHNFEGWILDPTTNVTSTIPADRTYQNKTGKVTIKGDIDFTVNAPEGAWLIFDENGKGGKYNAPQFVKRDQVTQKPCADTDMIRNGYNFGGWYSKVSDTADSHGYHQVVESSLFTFGQPLDSKTTLYAKWTPKETAPYTVIFWTQKEPVNGQVDYNKTTGYDLKDSVVVNNGTVGRNIPYTINNNNNGDEKYVRVNGRDYHYTGFCVQQPEQQVTITPEGDAVLNIYFDRIKYDLRFYLYRRDGNGNNDYQFAQNSAAGQNIWGVVNWWNKTNLDNMPTTTYPGGIQSQSGVGGNNITGYYIVLSAYYGEDISGKWPTYDMITSGRSGNTYYAPVSYVMMVGTKLKPNASSGGDGTLKGVYNRMDENILGATNDADGNFLIVRFNSYNDWTYHLYFEAYDGQDLTGKITRVVNRKTYYQDIDFQSRSSNTLPGSQNPPQYAGFSAVMQSGSRPYYDQVYIDGVLNGSPQANSVSGHKAELNYYYDRLSYPVNYMDGTYFDGKGNIVQSRSNELLHTSENIDYKANIPDSDAEYTPSLPVGESGYVFAGWYADAACNTLYTFDTMPIGGITVYAKWVQVQYRVFMHPNAGTKETEPNLNWGSEAVSMSFRVDYGSKVSLPRGTREGSGYEFVGWYTDPNFSSSSLFSSDILLNDETVTTPYYNPTELDLSEIDQAELDPTELDNWGNPYMSDGVYVDEYGNQLEPTKNKDYNEKRFWITKKLDLYAKWRKILEGSEGIKVVYTADDGKEHVGTNPPTDESEYPDQTHAMAQAACTAPTGMYFKYWVIQTWDPDANNGEGGYVDTELTVDPSDKFTVKEEYAQKAEVAGQPGKYTYTMQLRAEYGEPEDGVPTHIWWFDNYPNTSTERQNSSHQDENIQINEAINILEKPANAPEGYTFLGWARVETDTSKSEAGTPPTGKVLKNLNANNVYLKYENGEFKLNDSTSEHNGKTVTQVAADERLQYHDMYAVWEPIEYEVTVKKVVIGTDDDKLIDFTFTPKTDETVGTTFTLKHGQTSTAFKVKYQQLFSVTETPVTGFDTSVVAMRTTDASRTALDNPVQVTPEESGAYKIEGDVEITVTNSRESAKLKLYKYDSTAQGTASEIGLPAEFALYKDTDVANNEPKSGASPVATFSTSAETGYSSVSSQLNAGTYYLFETQTPDGYDSLEYPWVVTIDPSGQHTNIVTVTENGTALPNAVVGPDNDVYTIKVPNNPGVELPESGGPGTTWIYLLGVILFLGSGIVLVSRRRIGKAE